jgi:peroxiredoxin
MPSDAASPRATRLQPGQAVPPLRLRTLSGRRWDLAEHQARHPGQMVLIVVYRGVHCDSCRQHLRELAALVGEFAAHGVAVIAVSSDSRERAESAHEEWALQGLNIGYAMPLDAILSWGLALSPGRGYAGSGIVEPPLFAEPGLFLIRADGRLQAAALGVASFSRPRLRELLRALELLVRQRPGQPAA